MCRGFDPWARLTFVHISAYPLIEFKSPITLANSAVGLLTTEMTGSRSFMHLIENGILKLFIMRN